MESMTRRRCLLAIAQAVAATSLVACGGGGPPATLAEIEEESVAMLGILVFDLFPHEELDAAIYADAARQIAALEDPAVEQGLADLRARVGEGSAWADLPEDERVRILASREHSEFFTTLRTLSIENLYRREAVWELIGYGGSAIEHGGYVERGFDDIDWLPATAGEGAR